MTHPDYSPQPKSLPVLTTEQEIRARAAAVVIPTLLKKRLTDQASLDHLCEIAPHVTEVVATYIRDGIAADVPDRSRALSPEHGGVRHLLAMAGVVADEATVGKLADEAGGLEPPEVGEAFRPGASARLVIAAVHEALRLAAFDPANERAIKVAAAVLRAYADILPEHYQWRAGVRQLAELVEGEGVFAAPAVDLSAAAQEAMGNVDASIRDRLREAKAGQPTLAPAPCPYCGPTSHGFACSASPGFSLQQPGGD